MEIIFSINSEARELNTKCPEVLSYEDIEKYFKEIISKKDEIKEAHEIVDFTEVKEFKSSTERFFSIAGLYERIVKDKIIKKTTFNVRTQYQYGMARMYTGIAQNTEMEFDYIFEGRQSK